MPETTRLSRDGREVEVRPWPFNGYAPGDYFCKCVRCEHVFVGDKRAVACLDCAVITAHLAAQQAARGSGDGEVRKAACRAVLEEWRRMIANMNEAKLERYDGFILGKMMGTADTLRDCAAALARALGEDEGGR